MSIPQMHTAPVPQLVNQFASQWTKESSAAFIKILEAGFYSSLHGKGFFEGRRLAKWAHETSFAYINEIQVLFNIANMAFLALSAEKLCSSLQKDYDFSLIHDVPWPSIFAMTGLALISNLVNKVAAVNLVRENQHLDEQQIVIVERMSRSQRFTELLHIVQLVVNIALAYLEENQISTAISLGATTYSCWKNSQFHWITFSRQFPCTLHFYPVRKINATYQLLALPPNKANHHAPCPVCLEEDRLEKISFCANHSLHKLCVMELVRQKTDQFKQIEQIKKFKVKHYQNGVCIDTTFHYDITIDQKNLPACPECRSVPLQNTLDMSISDAIHGELNSSLSVKRSTVDRQYLYENMNAIYCTAQAGFTLLQMYPELAGMIYKIQKFMLVVDLIAYGTTFHYLYRNIHLKYDPNHSKAVKIDIAIVVSMALAAVASWYILLHVQANLNPTLVLNDRLKQEGFSDDVIKSLDLGFDPPWQYTMIQTVLVNRLIGSIALTFFSKKRSTNLLSVAMQATSFVGISSLKWIQVVQKLDQNLLFKVVGEESWRERALFHIKSSETTHHFLVDSLELAHLSTKLKTIADTTLCFFKRSRWENYWEVTQTDGVETGRKLWYKIIVQNNPITRSGDSFASHLVETKVRILDALKGEANVIINNG